MKIGYARVSTGEQSLDMQVDALEEAGCEKVFTDQVSGTKEDRPGIEEATDYMREGDTLVVWKLDRLGRSLTDLVDKVTGLREEGMEFESLQEKIDTTSAGGRFQFHVFSALAQFERDLISERTKAGLRAARARGKSGGRPRAMNEEQVRRVAELVAESDWSIQQICETFGISRSTLYRYVSPEGEIRRSGASGTESSS